MKPIITNIFHVLKMYMALKRYNKSHVQTNIFPDDDFFLLWNLKAIHVTIENDPFFRRSWFKRKIHYVHDVLMRMETFQRLKNSKTSL